MHENHVIYQPDTFQTYFDLWMDDYRIKDFSQFSSMTSNVVRGIATVIVILHLITSFLLLRPIYHQSGDGLVRQFLKAVHTFINPPLFCDWEEIYRHSNYKILIKDAWYKFINIYAKFQALFVVEHLLLLIPMIWLKIDVERRNAVLNGSIFKVVPDEKLSTYKVNVLLALGFLVTFLAPLLQAGLAYAYFQFGHPWSRVWKTNILSSNIHSTDQRRDMREDLVTSTFIKQSEISQISKAESEKHESIHSIEDPTHKEFGGAKSATDEVTRDYIGDNIEDIEMLDIEH